jgi:hypothetical protein
MLVRLLLKRLLSTTNKNSTFNASEFAAYIEVAFGEMQSGISVSSFELQSKFRPSLVVQGHNGVVVVAVALVVAGAAAIPPQLVTSTHHAQYRVLTLAHGQHTQQRKSELSAGRPHVNLANRRIASKEKKEGRKTPTTMYHVRRISNKARRKVNGPPPANSPTSLTPASLVWWRRRQQSRYLAPCPAVADPPLVGCGGACGGAAQGQSRAPAQPGRLELQCRRQAEHTNWRHLSLVRQSERPSWVTRASIQTWSSRATLRKSRCRQCRNSSTKWLRPKNVSP